MRRAPSDADLAWVFKETPGTTFVTISKAAAARVNRVAVKTFFAVKGKPLLGHVPGDPEANPSNFHKSQRLDPDRIQPDSDRSRQASDRLRQISDRFRQHSDRIQTDSVQTDSDRFRQIQTDSEFRQDRSKMDSDRFQTDSGRIQTDSDRLRQIKTDSERFPDRFRQNSDPPRQARSGRTGQLSLHQRGPSEMTNIIFRCSTVVSIPAYHAGDPGSSPGGGAKHINLYVATWTPQTKGPASCSVCPSCGMRLRRVFQVLVADLGVQFFC